MREIKSHHRVIARNSIWLGLSKVIQVLVNLAASVMIARYLGVRHFGQYAIIFMTVTVFEIAFSGGFCTVVTREVARHKNMAGDYFYSAAFIQGIISLIMIFFLPLFIWFIYREPSLLFASLIAAFSMCLRSIHALSVSLFWAFERMDYELKLIAVGRLLYIVFLSLAIAMDRGIVGIFTALLSAQFAQTVMGVYLIRKGVTSLLFTEVKWLQKFIFREGWVISVNSFLSGFVFRIHGFLLKILSGDFSVGVFSVAIRIFEQGKMFPRIPLVSAFPHMCRLGMTDRYRLKKYLRNMLCWAAVVCLPAALALFFLSERLILFLYGEQFLASAKVVKILSITVFFIPANMVFHYIYVAMNKQNLSAFLLGISVLFYAGLGVALIVPFDYTGAAWAFVGGEIVFFMLNLFSFFVFFGINPDRNTGKAASLCCLSSLGNKK